MKKKRAFTIIELVVIIAVIGILVLLAMPKFLGHTKEAKLAQIKNDVKVNESYTENNRANNVNFTEHWTSIDKNKLEQYNEERKLYSKKGLLKNNYEFEGEYQKIPDEEKNSKLDGDFFVNEEGDTLYYDEKLSFDDDLANETCTFNGEVNRIAVGGSGFAAYLTDDGEVMYWGGLMGYGTSENLKKIDGFENIKSIRIADTSGVYGIDENCNLMYYGVLYNSEDSAFIIDKKRALNMKEIYPELTNIIDVSGDQQGLAVRNDGVVLSWGQDVRALENEYSTLLVRSKTQNIGVAEVDKTFKVVGGANHSTFALENGKVLLSSPFITSQSSHEKGQLVLNGLSNVKNISSSYFSEYIGAVRENGEAYYWRYFSSPDKIQTLKFKINEKVKSLEPSQRGFYLLMEDGTVNYTTHHFDSLLMTETKDPDISKFSKLDNVVEIATSYTRVVFLLENGKVFEYDEIDDSLKEIN